MYDNSAHFTHRVRIQWDILITVSNTLLGPGKHVIAIIIIIIFYKKEKKQIWTKHLVLYKTM